MKVTILKAADGASVSKLSPANQASNPIFEFNGPSHSKGGIPISFGGKKVEVEGGEAAFVDNQNDLNIMGNMKVPGTGIKFKQASKNLADKEKKNQEILDNGTILVNTANPEDKWESLAFNSGKAMLIGGKMKQEELATSKEWLSTIQNTMLEHAKEIGIEPQDYSKGKFPKAKWGKKMEDGGDDNAKRKPKTDDVLDSTDYRKIEPIQATSPSQIITKRVQGNSKYSVSTPSNFSDYLSAPKIFKPKQSVTYTPNFTPLDKDQLDNLGKSSITDTQNTIDNSNQVDNSQLPPFDFEESPEQTPQVGKALSFDQLLPEIYTAATNKQQAVFSQKFQPQLLSPYKVSFQDRLNENQASFNALTKQSIDNPALISTIGAQKYAADSQVKGEEFRTNQGIASDIINKNTQLLNDATQENLKLADLQYTRQSEAKSNTKALNEKVLASVSAKMLENKLNNQRLKIYQNLTKYNYNPQTGEYQYFGPGLGDLINFDGNPQAGSQGAGDNTGDNRTITTYNPDGTVKQTRVTQPGQIDVKGKSLLNTTRQFNLMKSFYSPKGIVPYTPPR